MLFLGASSLVLNAQEQPTGAPDTSVRSKPSAAQQAVTNTPAQKVATPSEKKGGMSVGLIGAIAFFVVGGVVIIAIRSKSKKKE